MTTTLDQIRKKKREPLLQGPINEYSTPSLTMTEAETHPRACQGHALLQRAPVLMPAPIIIPAPVACPLWGMSALELIHL